MGHRLPPEAPACYQFALAKVPAAGEGGRALWEDEMRNLRTWMPIVAATAALLIMAGCSSTRDNSIGAIPTDLPANPNPCASYCKEWVPPVSRKVPKLVKCCPGSIEETPYTVMETTYEDVLVKPRTCECRTGCGTTCEEQLVETRPGGYRWTQTAGGCWKYEYCKPDFKWCKRTVTEDGVDYCVEQSPEYRTVARTREVRKTRRQYVPPKYEIRYVDENYAPGHYRWRASYDKPSAPTCGCRPTKTTKILDTCERCN